MQLRNVLFLCSALTFAGFGADSVLAETTPAIQVAKAGAKAQVLLDSLSAFYEKNADKNGHFPKMTDGTGNYKDDLGVTEEALADVYAKDLGLKPFFATEKSNQRFENFMWLTRGNLAVLLSGSSIKVEKSKQFVESATKDLREDTDPEQFAKIRNFESNLIAHVQALQRATVSATQKRGDDLRAGRIPMETLTDALYAFPAEADSSVVLLTPKVRPDGKTYQSLVVIDQVDGNVILVHANFGTPMQLLRGTGRKLYARLRLNKSSKVSSTLWDEAKIGGWMGFVGKYVQNDTVTTTQGEALAIPVFDVLFASNKP